jgi:hypothetical protein
MAFSTPTMIPTSISQAINFLTRPLIFSQEPDMIHSLQMILRSTLQAVYSAARTSRLVLPLSRTSLPPRPIYAACIASGLQWQEWIAVLGSRDFDLIIEPHSVSVTYVGPNPRTVIVWSEPISLIKRLPFSRLNLQGFQVPISKLGQQSFMQASLKATIGSAHTRANTRTLAQQLESDDKQEADELFAMISTNAIISPTPTREKFFMDIPMNAFPSPLSSPEVISPATSRPSSRSSTSSSSSSYFDTESITSASSTSSDFPSSTKPRDTFVPPSPRVFVDNDKKDVTKYLYQGGVSTVLTGGVMLGGSVTAKNLGAKPTDKISSSWRRTVHAF